MKTCNTCNKEKKLNHFNKNKEPTNVCGECRKKCPHGKRPSKCKLGCGGEELCIHGGQKTQCRYGCGGSTLCPCGLNKHLCSTHGGGNLCSVCKVKNWYREYDCEKKCRDCYMIQLEEEERFDILEELNSHNSKQVIEAIKILTDWNEPYELEKTFENQKTYNKIIGRCRFDIHLTRLNTIIEIHGKQHFQFTPHFHGHDIFNFLTSIERDRLKQKYCEDNYINFQEIHYNHNIYERLKEIVC